MLLPIRFAVVAAAVLLSGSAQAELLKSAETGFVARNAVTIAARPDQVWAALIAPARWWNPAHSWSGKAANFSLEARAGGCFCEALANGGSVEHQRVVFSHPGQLLRLVGGLGPLQPEAVSAVMNWELKADGEGTRLTQTYAVSGMVDGGLSGWAVPVDGVIREQLERLERLIEAGSPEAPPPGK
ncbi:MAG: ATPase [Xanthomonadaceae bacterium]|nr:ATPase [Xanthomonadaceae bacterium]